MENTIKANKKNFKKNKKSYHKSDNLFRSTA